MVLCSVGVGFVRRSPCVIYPTATISIGEKDDAIGNETPGTRFDVDDATTPGIIVHSKIRPQ